MSGVDSNKNIESYYYRRNVMKSARKGLSHIRLNSKLSETNYQNSPNSQLLQLDIDALNLYIKSMENEINIYNSPEKKILSNLKYNAQISKIKESLNIDINTYYTEINKSCLNISNLYKEYGVNSKEELIKQLSSINGYLILYLDKLKDLFFLINLSYSNNNNQYLSSDEYNDNSNFSCIKYHLDQLKKRNNNDLNNSINNNTLSFNNNLNYNLDIVNIGATYNTTNNNEFINKISSMKTFNDFLTHNDFDDENLKEATDKIKSLFYNDNEKVINLFLDFIPKKLKDSLPQINKMVSVINCKEYYNMIELVSSIRKILEEYINDLNKEINQKNKDIEILNFTIKKITDENEKNKKHLDVIINKDFITYIAEIKSENETFLKNIEEVSKNTIMKITNELLDKNEAYFELEKKCNRYQTEIICLKRDIEFNNKNYNKNMNEYIEALKVQIEDMKEGFIDDINDIKEKCFREKNELLKKIKLLENEKLYTKDLGKLLNKKINNIEKIFNVSKI